MGRLTASQLARMTPRSRPSLAVRSGLGTSERPSSFKYNGKPMPNCLQGESLLRALFETSEDAFVEVSLDGRIGNGRASGKAHSRMPA